MSACTALAGLAALPAQAQTWEGTFNSSWNIPANWDNSVVPGPADNVTIGTYVNAPVITGGYVANVSSVTIGAASVPSVLTIAIGELRNFGGPSVVGLGQGEEGHVNIQFNSLWDSLDNVFIGLDGTGRVNLDVNSVFLGAESVYIGFGETGDGMVSLDGASHWGVSNLLIVGGAGEGGLLAQNGSTANSREARIGALQGSEGIVTLATGSSWAVTDELFIGDGGEGSLRVLSGSTVTSDVGILGAQHGALGIARIDGAGSSWTTTAAMGVGYEGIGQVQIYDQAQVAVGTQAIIGFQQGSSGSVLIESLGSLSIAGSLNAGVDGDGRIAVEGGGSLSSAGAALGIFTFGYGTIRLDGAGSGWTNTGSLVLGDVGVGRLFVENGAGVTNTGATTLGLSEGGYGYLTVDNASFTTAEGLTIGGAGTGRMTVTGGGSVTSAQNAGDARIGFGGIGEAVVSEAGSTWTNHGQLVVGSMDIGGNAGYGVLRVTDNAQFTNNGIASVGHDSGSIGEVVVSGGTWTNTSALVVGAEGEGLLLIEDGGLVTATNSTIAAAAGSSGTVVANGSGIVWSSSGGLAIGGAGEAELAVGAGAIVVAQGAVDAAALATSSAQVTVNGVLAGLGGVTFNTNSRLSGTGTVSAGAAGTTTMNGVVAPGTSIGTLSIFGNYVQNAGSTYEVEIDAAGNSDLIDISGAATLNGGEVTVVPFPDFAVATPYTILTAAGGVTGQFDPVAGGFSQFLTPELTYDPNSVYLTLQQSATFASAALTPNQIATAQGGDSLPVTNPVWVAIASQPDAAAAQFAFDQLSGEVHGSLQTAMIDDSRFVRETALNRIRNAFGRVGGARIPVLAYGAGGPEAVSPDTPEAALWMHGFGSFGRWNSDGNAARLERSTGGLFVGGDVPLGDWRVGALAGYSRSDLDVDDRASSASMESWHLGLYGGAEWGEIAFRTGAAYSWHHVSTLRTVAFPGFADSVTGKYRAGVGQIFGELAYDLDFGAYRLEPFGNLAYVHHHRSSFAERGGPAALTVSAASTDTAFTTLGLRGAAEADLGGARATAHATLGWRHAFGDVTPTSRHAFAGGAPFTIAGAPIARDAAAVEAGVDLQFGLRTRFGLSYSGQLAGAAQSHGFNARLGVRF